MLVDTTKKRFFAVSYLVFCLLLIGSITSFSQTEIGGVINQYARVTALGSCPNVIQVNDNQEFSVGQTVLVIGMQGAEMSIENDATFGQVSSNNLTAGQYDWTEIERIQGNEITLLHPISTAYDVSQVVQLVGVPTYDNARVISDLIPMAWDGNLGGVLAIEVTGTLELSSNIIASGMGFRGGQSIQAADDNCTLLTSANNYFYASGNWRGSAKGEGIVPIASGRELGRGPQANGGGGANTHNAGGGGGSNRAQGGIGGQNLEPSFGGCKGFFPGLGGFSLDVGPDSWFMGGGGGAGHRNNTSMSSGGNGGGVVVVKAGSLDFNGGGIFSDGEDGLGASGDGAGGGGSGGTVILDIDNLTGTAVVNARGGRGGDVNNQSDRCMGPGGGGSGGQVYSTLALTPVLDGGGTGLSLGSSVCSEGSNGALPGENGTWEMAGIKTPSLMAGIEIISLPGDTSICPGESLDLSVLLATSDAEVNYQWLSLEGENWVPLTDGDNFQGATSANLQVNNLELNTSFQIQVEAECVEPFISEAIRVDVNETGAPLADFTYELTGFSAAFTNLSEGADAYEWTIEEIPFYSSTEAEPEFTFPAYGTYQVNLWAQSNCGSDSISQVITIGGPPIADFYGESSGSRCVPVTIQWTDQSVGIYETYQWNFPGGTPSSSVEPNPIVVYDQPGEYDVILTVTGPLGSDTHTQEKIVKVFSPPQPAFSYQIEGLTVSFTSSAEADLVHIWSFDDGNTSNDKDPVHTFAGPGAYDVTLNLQNGGCASTITQTVLVFTTNVENHQLSPFLEFYPNPTAGPLWLEGENPELYPLDLFLFNAKGQLLNQLEMIRPGLLDLSAHSSGLYFVLVRSPLGVGSWRIIKQ